QKSAGPSYADIAKRYKNNPDAVNLLADKIIRGGSGQWGTIEMAAHPQISVEDARQMVAYIMTLDQNKVKSLPLEGVVTPGKETEGAYLLNASYADKGAGEIPSLSAANTHVLR